MMKLNDLYPGVGTDLVIKRVVIDSKKVEKGDLFVCTMDVDVDRHELIDEAISNGVSAVIVCREVGYKNVPIIKVPDTNRELPYLCQKFYDYPDRKLKMIGVTGTDGKTSTATIIQSLIGSVKCGFIGTNGRSCAAFNDDTSNEVLNACLLYDYLDEFLKFNCKYVAMVTSSEDFFRGRVQSVEYDVAVYTNVTSEHLNVHGSFENYLNCKLRLFKQVKKDGICVLNSDDLYFEHFKRVSNGRVVTYGKGEGNTLRIVSYKVYPNKTDIVFDYKGNEFEVGSPLLGEFNVYNLAAGLLASLEIGFKLEDILKNVGDLKIDGRSQLLNTKTPYYVMVDCAHTVNSIHRLLNFVSTLDINRKIVVIGQDGDKDNNKRAVVGKVVCDNADHVIFTYKDPRNEDPKKICEEIISDIKNTHTNYEIIIDRREAIQKAINMAKEKDFVLILGKGNETDHIVKDKKVYFDDIEEAYQAVVSRNLEEENSR